MMLSGLYIGSNNQLTTRKLAEDDNIKHLHEWCKKGPLMINQLVTVHRAIYCNQHFSMTTLGQRKQIHKAITRANQLQCTYTHTELNSNDQVNQKNTIDEPDITRAMIENTISHQLYHQPFFRILTDLAFKRDREEYEY